MGKPDSLIDPAALRRARTSKGLTQGELARLIGVAGGERVSRWELGSSEPRPDVLVRLAEVLDVETAVLLTPPTRGQGLRRLRTLAGLSARQLADQAHLSLASVQRWEAGRLQHLPPETALVRIAEAVKATPAAVADALNQARRSTRDPLG